LETDKKLVNHSTRKHLVQKLVDKDIPPTEIMQITGHKNVASINNYSTLSDKKQKQIPGVLSGTTQGRPGREGQGGYASPPIVETRRKVGNLLCRNLRGQAYLHIRAGILFLFVVGQCKACLNKN
jgi:hypothetical protein